MGTLIGRKRSGSIRVRSSSGLPIVEQTFEYTVQAVDRFENQVSILSTPGIPIVNGTITLDGGAICNAVRADRDPDNATIWDVVAEFSSEVQESQQNPDPATSPVAWLPVRETKFERIQEVVSKDQAGAAIANSAGQPFPNGMTITRLLPVWEFFQFEPASITDETVIDRSEIVNSGEFKGKAAKTFLLTVLSSVLGFYYGQPLRLTKYSLKYNAKTWQHSRLDVGTVFLSGGNLEPYLDNAGNVISGPLNGSGAQQAAGTAPAIRNFDMYATNDFSFLRI